MADLDNIFISLFDCFEDDTSIVLNDSLLIQLSNIFGLNVEKLKDNSKRQNKKGSHSCCEELKEIVHLVATISNLASIKKVKDSNDMDSIIGECRCMTALFNSRCASIGASEDIKRGDYPGKNTPYFNSGYFEELINRFVVYQMDENISLFNDTLYCFCYQMLTRLVDLYLFNSIKLIKNNDSLFGDHIAKAAAELYDSLLFVLKNAHIVGIGINNLSLNEKIEYSVRGSSDNTTRFCIGYGYDNFDYYFLRFDLSHKGVDYSHFNFRSPGGIEAPCLNEDDYNLIVHVVGKDVAEKSFIHYEGGQYYLKEQHEAIESFLEDGLIADKHKELLVSHDEKVVCELINIISKMMSFCLVPIDTNGLLDGSLLKFDRIMSLLTLRLITDMGSFNDENNERFNSAIEELIYSRASAKLAEPGFDVRELSVIDIVDMFAYPAIDKLREFFTK